METGIVWELLTPAGTLVFDPFGQESSLGLSRIDGMGGAELRSAVSNLPQSDGAIVFSAFRGARYPILEGFVRTFNDLAARRLVLDQIVAYTDTIRLADGTLRFTPTGAPQRELTVRLNERVQISAGEGVRKEFQISLVAADHRVYGSELKHVEDYLAAGTDSGGRRTMYLTASNNGTTPTPPVIRVDGPIAAPLVFAYTPSLVQLYFPNLTLVAGEFMYIDVGRELVVRNGGTESLVGFLDIASATYWQLPLGSWTVGLQGNAAGWTAATKYTVSWRDAFI